MSVFRLYAEYYDLIYSDKDYTQEAEFVRRVLKKYMPEAKSILDLGCGTGGHALPLAEMGYTVTGIDRSLEMITVAQKRKKQITCAGQVHVTFAREDIRNMHLGRYFDSVISLFHVLSYQTADEDANAMLETVARHLKPEGVCLVDFWYGPAVLSNPPTVRVKQLENDRLKIVRISQPHLCPNDNVVEVKYLFMVLDKRVDKLWEFEETHRMRYFFMPEITTLLKNAGLELRERGEWLTQDMPGTTTWSVYVLAERDAIH